MRVGRKYLSILLLQKQGKLFTMYEIKIGKLTCICSTVARSDKVCYVLLPQALEVDSIANLAAKHGYHLAIICGMAWPDDLTPWPARGLRRKDGDFGGRAEEFLRLMHGSVMPTIEQSLSQPHIAERLLLGVSLSALFALWSWARSDDFDHIACVSGSFWYDRFADYIEQGGAKPKRGCAYLSLGDKEAGKGRSRFSTVGENTARIVAVLNALGIRTLYEQTAGNHFAALTPRFAKAFEGIARLKQTNTVCEALHGI